MSKTHAFVTAAMVVGLAVSSGDGNAATGKCTYAKIAEWPARLENGELIVDGTINGKKIGIMLDTGIDRSLILQRAATRLGLATQKVPELKIVGLGGETDVESALVDEFTIGEATRKGWWVIIAGDIDFGRNADFILGEDFFRFVDVEFDLAHNAVRLFRPQDCEGASLAYWAAAGAGQVDIEKVSETNPQIRFTVQVNGVAMRALLDSGAATTVINLRDAERAGVTPNSAGVIAIASGRGVGKNTIDSWVGPFTSFTIGDERIKDTTIRIADLWKDSTAVETGSGTAKPAEGLPAMLLGTDFLRAHRVLIAHSQRKIYFTYSGGPVFSIDVPMEGLTEPAKDTGSNPKAKSSK